VVKNSGTREIFDRGKLLAGLFRACEKTPITALQLERLVHDIELQLSNLGDQEVSTSRIGDMVMDRLADLNEVAYVRFASVYRRFRDIESFERELSNFKQEKSK
jgi:transcriptional repressor NrdR